MAVVTSAMVALAAGSVGAIAATSQDERKKAEQAVLDDAAKRLDVTPEKLRDALRAAQDAQLDQAVKDGKLTRAQADAIKKRRAESGTVLGGPGFGHHGRGGPGFGHRGGPGGRLGVLAGAANALGMTERSLHEQLHDGKTLAEIAKAENKDLADVKAAARKAAADRLAAAVKANRITDAQRDAMLKQLDEMIERLATEGLPRRGRGFHGGRPGAGDTRIRPGADGSLPAPYGAPA
jgi:hypothetical protein